MALVVAVLALVARFDYDHGYTGDEPHYLVITQSLVTDHDFDVKNEYLSGAWRAYYGGQGLDAHVNIAIFHPDSPHWYSQHGAGLPILLVPGYLANGAGGTSLEMVLVGLLLVGLTGVWTWRATRSGPAALFAALALGTTYSFIDLAGYVFPDLLTACLLVLAFVLLEGIGHRSRPWEQIALVALGLVLGATVWVHIKTALPSAIVGGCAIWLASRRAPTSRARVASLTLLAAAAAVPLTLFELANHSWYGSWHPRVMGLEPGVTFGSPLTNLAPALFDRGGGLLATNPMLLLVPVGLPLWARRDAGQALRVIATATAAFALQLSYFNWQGGYAPVGRLSMDFLPLLLPAVGFAFSAPSLLGRVAAAAVVAAGAAYSVVYVRLGAAWSWSYGTTPPVLHFLDAHHLHVSQWFAQLVPFLGAADSAQLHYLLACVGVVAIALVWGFVLAVRTGGRDAPSASVRTQLAAG